MSNSRAVRVVNTRHRGCVHCDEVAEDGLSMKEGGGNTGRCRVPRGSGGGGAGCFNHPPRFQKLCDIA